MRDHNSESILKDFRKECEFRDGDVCQAIAVSLDIVRSSVWEGAKAHKALTKANLSAFLTSAMQGRKSVISLPWEGDGGAFLFPLQTDQDYDNALIAADFALYSLSFFNSSKPYLCTIDVTAEIRIVCDIVDIVYYTNHGNISGDKLNYILKYEKKIGEPNKLVITEDLYNEIYNHDLKNRFRFLKEFTDPENKKTQNFFCCERNTSFAMRRYKSLRSISQLIEGLSSYNDIFERHTEFLLADLNKELKKLYERKYSIIGLSNYLLWMNCLYNNETIDETLSLCRLNEDYWNYWNQNNFPNDFQNLTISASSNGTKIKRLFLVRNILDCVLNWRNIIFEQASANIELRLMEEEDSEIKVSYKDFAICKDSEKGITYLVENETIKRGDSILIETVISVDNEKTNDAQNGFVKLWEGRKSVKVSVVDSKKTIEPISIVDSNKNISIRQLMGDRIVLRSFRPLRSEYPNFAELCKAADLERDRIPRKCDRNYAKLIYSYMLKMLDFQPQNYLYFGDSILNDGSVIRNLERVSGAPVYGYLCKETEDRPSTLHFVGNLAVSSNWSLLIDFIKECIKNNDKLLQSDTVAIFDMDKTIFAACGRNDQPIKTARKEATLKIGQNLLSDENQRKDFIKFYNRLDSAEYHHLTHDNQDYLVFIAILCATRLVDFEDIDKKVASSPDYNFKTFFVENILELTLEATNRRGHAKDIYNLIKDFQTAFQKKDPTPFKEFRRMERISTLDILAKPIENEISEILVNNIVLTREIVEVANLFQHKGVPIFVFSDRPEESTIPHGYTMSDGPFEKSLLDQLLPIVGSELGESDIKLF